MSWPELIPTLGRNHPNTKVIWAPRTPRGRSGLAARWPARSAGQKVCHGERIGRAMGASTPVPRPSLMGRGMGILRRVLGAQVIRVLG